MVMRLIQILTLNYHLSMGFWRFFSYDCILALDLSMPYRPTISARIAAHSAVFALPHVANWRLWGGSEDRGHDTRCRARQVLRSQPIRPCNSLNSYGLREPFHEH